MGNNNSICIDHKLQMLESMTRILSEKYDVEVIFSKEGECKTSRKLMILPYNSAIDEGMILGLAGHEIGHLIHTDFSVCEEIAKKSPVDNRVLLFNITNTLEDVRVEREIETEFPGFVKLFSYLIPYTKQYKQAVLPDLPSLQKALDVLYLRLRNYDSTWYESDINCYVDDVLLEAGKEVLKAQSTRDVLRIAEQIYQIIIDSNNNEVSSQVSKQAISGEAGGANLLAEAQTSNNEIAIRTGSEEQLSKKQHTIIGLPHGKSRLVLVDAIAEKIKKESANESLSKACRPLQSLLPQIIKQQTKQIQKERVKTGTFEYNVHPICLQEPQETEYDVELGSLEEYKRTYSTVANSATIIRRRLHRILNDKNAMRWTGLSNKGVRLNRKILHRIPLGEQKIFRKKAKTLKENFAITLLIDESGSMQGDKIIQAQRCAIMFSEILNGLKVPFEVIGFSTCDLTIAQKNKIKAMSARTRDRLQRAIWDRSDNLKHSMYKRFDEQFSKVKTRLQNIAAKISNYDQDHLEFAWNRLRNRTEVKKILIIISDSLPCGGTIGHQKLKKMVNQIESNKNAKCIAIGIRAPHLPLFYRHYINIKEVSELGTNVASLIEGAILGKSIAKIVDESNTDLFVEKA